MTRRIEARLLGHRPHLRHLNGVALLLPGGDVESRTPLPAWDVSVLRMRMFHGAIETVSAGRVAPLTLKYRYVGWNAPARHPVTDARWALDAIGRRYPGLPVVLVGHSMGGRVALHVAEHPAVAGVCGLAPWITGGERPEMLADRPLLVAHAPNDPATNPGASRDFVARAQAAGLTASWREMRFDSHPMLVRAVTWHRLAAGFVLRCVHRAPGMPAARDRRLPHG